MTAEKKAEAVREALIGVEDVAWNRHGVMMNEFRIGDGIPVDVQEAAGLRGVIDNREGSDTNGCFYWRGRPVRHDPFVPAGFVAGCIEGVVLVMVRWDYDKCGELHAKHEGKMPACDYPVGHAGKHRYENTPAGWSLATRADVIAHLKENDIEPIVVGGEKN